MTHDEIRLVSIVKEDLEFLRNEWDQSVLDASLRRSSNVLRNLLVEGQFGKAWRALGRAKEPRVTAPDLDVLVDTLDLATVSFASAGGAKSEGMRARASLFLNVAQTLDQIRAGRQGGPFGSDRVFGLSQFLRSTCLVHDGVRITRRELIQYVANKCGGVHIDFSRDPSKELERKFLKLDSIRDHGEVAGRSAIYYELLSVGQAVAEAEDTRQFLEDVAAAAET